MPAIDSRNVQLQERDVSLLRDLVESRVLTLDHIRTLFFADTKDMAKKRVQRLKAAGFLTERPRRIGDPLGDIWMTAAAYKQSAQLCSMCD